MSRTARAALGVVIAVAILAAASAAGAQDLPELTRPVNDFAGVVDAASAAEMDRVIRALQQATGDVVVVATVPTFAPYADIREYAVKLFENRGRGIGERDKHNGLLVLLAVQDRKVWIEVGYGLEEWIPDGFAGETSRQYMLPSFRQGDYGGGLRAGVARIVGRIADGRQVKLDGVQPVRPARARSVRGVAAPVILVAIILLMVALQGLGGGGGSFGPRSRYRRRTAWGGWDSGVGPFGGGGFGGGFGGGGFGGGGFGGFGGGGSGGGGGGASW